MGRKNGQEEKRTRIVEALHICLTEKPFDQTSIKDIARAAGVNHGLLHYYFRSKEDILLHYIDHVIGRYKAMFEQWLMEKQAEGLAGKDLAAAFFDFMNDRITLDRQLSTVFIEIWEIAVYNPIVRNRLRQAYREWMEALAFILGGATADPAAAKRISIAVVAFLEGISMFSVILDPDDIDLREVLTGFQNRIIEML
jgi:TetR/AcrR family transcriptional regulator, transcriptional repressor of bet genes